MGTKAFASKARCEMLTFVLLYTKSSVPIPCAIKGDVRGHNVFKGPSSLNALGLNNSISLLRV